MGGSSIIMIKKEAVSHMSSVEMVAISSSVNSKLEMSVFCCIRSM